MISHLVPAEPLADASQHGLGNIVNVVVLLGQLVVDGDGQNLPVELTVVNHGEDAKGLDLGDGSHLEGLGADLDDVDRIVVAEDLELGVLLCYYCKRKETIRCFKM